MGTTSFLLSFVVHPNRTNCAPQHLFSPEKVMMLLGTSCVGIPNTNSKIEKTLLFWLRRKKLCTYASGLLLLQKWNVSCCANRCHALYFRLFFKGHHHLSKRQVLFERLDPHPCLPLSLIFSTLWSRRFLFQLIKSCCTHLPPPPSSRKGRTCALQFSISLSFKPPVLVQLSKIVRREKEKWWKRREACVLPLQRHFTFSERKNTHTGLQHFKKMPRHFTVDS